MLTVPPTFVFALSVARDLQTRIMGFEGMIGRTGFVRAVVAVKVRAGVRALEAFLRRLLILLALEMEPFLNGINRPQNMARAKVRKLCLKKPFLRIYPTDAPASDFNSARAMAYDPRPKAPVSKGGIVAVGHWLAQLDYLYTLTKDPLAKARRLSFTLARRRHGILMAPYEPPKRVRRWGLEVSTIYDAMAMQIITKSKSRPPPLMPPWRGPKPSITAFW